MILSQLNCANCRFDGCRVRDPFTPHGPWRGSWRLSPTMMPVSLLIALLLAFGIEPAQTDVPEADVIARVLETCGAIMLVAALAFGLGFWVSLQVANTSYRPRWFGGSTALAPAS